MQVMNELLKSAGMEQIGPYLPQMLDLGQRAPHNSVLGIHNVIRKSAIKVSGRVGLKQLPHLKSAPNKGQEAIPTPL